MKNIFERYPNMQSYFQTSDGTAFFDYTCAVMHAKTLLDRKVEEVHRAAEQSSAPVEKAVSAKDIIAQIPTMDLETAETALSIEQTMEQPRKTVIEAFTKRIKELKTLNNEA